MPLEGGTPTMVFTSVLFVVLLHVCQLAIARPTPDPL